MSALPTVLNLPSASSPSVLAIPSTSSSSILVLTSSIVNVVVPTPPSSTTNAAAALPAPIAVIGSNTIAAQPGSSGVILPDGSSATVGQVVTLTGSDNTQVVVSVASSGIFLQGASGSATFIANPTPTPQPTAVPTPVATIDGQIINAVPGASTLVIGDQTLTVGSPAITIHGTNNIATLGSSGLIIQYPDGVSSTFVANPIPTAQAFAKATPIATLGGQVISALPGASTLVIGDQTLSVGSPAVTIQGTNEVATLGRSGLIIQYPSGVASTFALPTATSGSLATIDGTPISTLSGGSAVVIGGQTVSVGGAPITLADHIVVSLASGGLIIQEPSGVQSTLALSVPTAPSTPGIANIIASSKFQLCRDLFVLLTRKVAGVPLPSVATNVMPHSSSGNSSSALSRAVTSSKSSPSAMTAPEPTGTKLPTNVVSSRGTRLLNYSWVSFSVLFLGLGCWAFC